MTLLNLIIKAYERWLERRRFGKLESLSHYCVHRVLENGERISYMVATKPRPVRTSCEFILKCPREWEGFTPTNDASIRHCSACDRAVHLTRTDDEFRQYDERKDCVAVIKIWKASQWWGRLGLSTNKSKK
jgi:hypothetical protein